MQVTVSEACAIQPEVRYFWTSNRHFPGSLLYRPQNKRNEDSGYEFKHIQPLGFVEHKETEHSELGVS